jgi:hypothetical protein
MSPLREITLVRQRSVLDCGIATAAMIAGATYDEAWSRLAPPPASPSTAAAYNQRETQFLNEKGWWASVQVALHTVVPLDDLMSVIRNDTNVRQAFERAQRVRLVLAFADGAKPDHTVVWDSGNEDVVYDPSRGIIRVSEIFNNAGLQSYGGTLGMTSFSYQPGQPILAWIITEEGFVPPTGP